MSAELEKVVANAHGRNVEQGGPKFGKLFFERCAGRFGGGTRGLSRRGANALENRSRGAKLGRDFEVINARSNRSFTVIREVAARIGAATRRTIRDRF